jgi:hypothetical protein
MADWLDDLDNEEREQWDRFVEHTRRSTVEQMSESAFVASIVPKGEVGHTDIKFAVELGLAIMMNKPIIAIIMPGAKIPARLSWVADRIIEADIDTQEGRDRVASAIESMVK